MRQSPGGRTGARRPRAPAGWGVAKYSGGLIIDDGGGLIIDLASLLLRFQLCRTAGGRRRGDIKATLTGPPGRGSCMHVCGRGAAGMGGVRG